MEYLKKMNYSKSMWLNALFQPKASNRQGRQQPLLKQQPIQIQPQLQGSQIQYQQQPSAQQQFVDDGHQPNLMQVMNMGQPIMIQAAGSVTQANGDPNQVAFVRMLPFRMFDD